MNITQFIKKLFFSLWRCWRTRDKSCLQPTCSPMTPSQWMISSRKVCFIFGLQLHLQNPLSPTASPMCHSHSDYSDFYFITSPTFSLHRPPISVWKIPALFIDWLSAALLLALLCSARYVSTRITSKLSSPVLISSNELTHFSFLLPSIFPRGGEHSVLWRRGVTVPSYRPPLLWPQLWLGHPATLGAEFLQPDGSFHGRCPPTCAHTCKTTQLCCNACDPSKSGKEKKAAIYLPQTGCREGERWSFEALRFLGCEALVRSVFYRA